MTTREADELAAAMDEREIGADEVATCQGGAARGQVEVWRLSAGRLLIRKSDSAVSSCWIEDAVCVDMADLAGLLVDEDACGIGRLLSAAEARGIEAMAEAPENCEACVILGATDLSDGTTRIEIEREGSGVHHLILDRREAEAHVARADETVYYLAHGEMARPTYRIVAYPGE